MRNPEFFKFNKTYFVSSVLILLIELLIALYVRDHFVRPYLGDVLAVLLLYCLLKSFINAPVIALSFTALIIAFTVEFLQLFGLVEKIGLGDSAVMRTLIGGTFSWIDLGAYLSGTCIILVMEKRLQRSWV